MTTTNETLYCPFCSQQMLLISEFNTMGREILHFECPGCMATMGAGRPSGREE